MNVPIKELDGRKVCDCREAAKILGVSMGRVRQMARDKSVWSVHATDRALLLDKREIKRISTEKARARAAGRMRGAPPRGFQPDT